MKKIYTILALIAVAFAANAQSNNHTGILNPTIVNPAPSQTPQIVHYAPPTTQALGDTVFVFDGGYIYDWNSTLPATFAVAVEDIDLNTIYTPYQTYFGVTGSFKFFYEIDPASTLHYSHADTVFFAGATSWFNTAAQASNWLEMGPIHVPTSGGTLKWRHNEVDKNFRDGYEVRVNTVGMASTNFVSPAIFTVADNAPATAGDTVGTPHPVFYQRTANVDIYAGQDIYVGFHHTGNDMNILYLNDFILVDDGLLGVAATEENGFSLSQNVPNPANGTTTFNYSLTYNSNVSFNVYDVMGNIVYSQNEANQSAGAHRFEMNTSSLSNGMYFYTIVVNGQKETRKMIVSNN